MELLERHTQLAELEAALRDAVAGQGSLVLVTGEAGAGKTSLVRRFTSAVAAGSRVLWGMCDELVTPRPLGPFHDMAGQVGGRLGAVIESGSPAEVSAALLGELGRPPHPAVALVEDAHWADEATLDVVRFLGRRVDRVPALLVVTYRDDEVPADHPLRLALGVVPVAAIRRVRLGPLSRYAVARLAGHSDIAELYRVTGGNAFYVTEMLAAPGPAVPHTVQDAVMARVGRLSDAGRECVEAASVVPTRAEVWLLDGCGVSAGIDEAARLGVFHVEHDVVRFSHELVRQAVEQSLAPGRRREINRQVLDVLAGHDTDPARLAHHAVQADDADAVVTFAPPAARRAASSEAHREAATHLERALRHPELFPPDELAHLLDEYAHECQLTGCQESARQALVRVIEMRGETGDRERLGASLRLLSDVNWFLGRGAEAKDAAARAVTVLEDQPAGRELAIAYAQRSKLAMLDFRRSEAIAWGNKAVDLARQLGDAAVLAHTLTSAGVARWQLGSDDDAPLLEGLALARGHGLTDEAARAYANLATGHTISMQYGSAGRYLDDGLAYCEEHDLIARADYLLATRAWWHMEQGRWREAEADARRLLHSGDISEVRALPILALIQVRRGDPAAEETLARADRLGDLTAEAQNLVPIALAHAERAWLAGDLEAVSRSASSVLALALDSGSSRWIGSTTFWLHRAGTLDAAPAAAAAPYALQIAGRWREAAARWERIGLPYEQADALAEAPEPAPLLEALAILERLGAVPRAAMVRRRLSELGVTSVPRGPREAARTSPAGLTARETEVLGLLAEDLTYQEIAGRLYVSAKTIDHHVTAVRRKLGVGTRAEAVAAARRLGILPEYGDVDYPK